MESWGCHFVKKILFTCLHFLRTQTGFLSSHMQGRISFQLHARISSKPTVTLVYYVTSHVVFSVTGSTSQKLQHSPTKCSSCPSFLPAATHALPCRKRALSERNACLHWSRFDDLCNAYRNPTITEDHQQFMLDGSRKVVLGYLLT